MEHNMNKFFIIPTVLALSVVSSCSSEPTTLPPGEYTSTHKSTNAQGTESKVETNTKVYYDQNGNKRAIQEKETSKDPEGLLNKSTTKTTKTY
jgi:hypothetical protein